MISVLLPSRGRPDALRESVTGLLGMAACAENVEIIVAADPDDAATQQVRPPRTGMLVAPERYGYANLHVYMNALASVATGKWLMMWNVDCRMLTPGWDEVILGEAPGILWPAVNYAPGINTFPVIPAAWVKALGHVSLDQSADMWWHDIGEMTGTMRKIPVSIRHEHLHGDQTTADKLAVMNVATFHTPEMDAARAADAAKIARLAAPLVSVLLPSRRRETLLRESIASLTATAAHPEQVEVLVAADPDDAATQGFTVAAPLAGRVLATPQRWGRGSLHEYYNWLAPHAAGRWLLIFNDDAVMETQGWDEIIRAQEPGVVVAGSNHGDHMFLAVPAVWADAAGYLSPTPDIDNFLFDVGHNLGCLRRPPLRIFHSPCYVTGANDDDTYREGLADRERFAATDWDRVFSGRGEALRRMTEAILELAG